MNSINELIKRKDKDDKKIIVISDINDDNLKVIKDISLNGRFYNICIVLIIDKRLPLFVRMNIQIVIFNHKFIKYIIKYIHYLDQEQIKQIDDSPQSYFVIINEACD